MSAFLQPPQQNAQHTTPSMDSTPQRQLRPRAPKRSGSDVEAMPRKRVHTEGTGTSRKGEKRPGDKEEHAMDAGPASHSTESKHSSGKASTRLQRFWLGFATPRIHFVPFGEQDRPQFVTELLRDLVKGNEQPVPGSLRKILMERYPADFTLSTGNLADAYTPLLHEFQLWDVMTTAFDEATKAQRKVYDENGWSRVAKALLEGSINVATRDNTRPRMFESLDVKAVSIGPVSLLPVFDGHPIPFKKVDFSVYFSRDYPEIGRLYNNINMHPDILLSQTEDPLVGYVCQLAAIEIKSSDGGYDASSLQLATWLAAGLENMRLLLERAREAQGIQGEDENELLPFIGITAVGHVWSLHIASKGKDGDVRLYGPVPMGDTCSSFGVFQILNVLARVLTWGRDVYFPWLETNILSPLAGQSADVTAVETESTAGIS